MFVNPNQLTGLRWVVLLPLALITYETISTAAEIVGVFRITHFETRSDAVLITAMFGIVLLFGVTCFWLCLVQKKRARPFTIAYFALPLVLSPDGILAGQITALITALPFATMIVFLSVSKRAKQTFVY